ncbi:hypothetical protein [Neisseria chenwenguii]|uniref:hypothetical protein n=1 Tax=Neisseria chenwenguii TaxID=1853278 RepID=UPI0012FE782A|nr:hypothetical protein [Neisseria chenwenguii]
MKKLVPTAVATGMFYVVFSNLIYPRLDTTIGKDLLFWLILLAACAVWVLIRKTR